MKSPFSRLPIFPSSRFLVFLVAATLLITTTAHAQVVEIPDPNLEGAIREALELPDGTPITQQEMLKLEHLDAGGNRGITDLTGLEHAINLTELGLYHNPITDIGPLAHLTNLERFNFWGCRIVDLSPLRNLKNLRGIILGSNQISDLEALSELTNLTFIELESNQISDVSPLAGLVNLTVLQLDGNQIVDFSPLANLVNLEELWINDNYGVDISSLVHLNIADFRYDEVCALPSFPPITARIENRTFPSVFAAWGGVGWSPVENRPDLTDEEHLILHDLYWSPFFTLDWNTNPAQPTHGVATSFAGDLAAARELRQRWLDQNPDMVFLVEVRLHNHFEPDAFPPDSDFWLTDRQGQILRNSGGEHLINFLKPEVQDLHAKRIIAVAQCGLYDGVMLDGFFLNGTGFVGKHLHTATDEEIMTATENILRTVRAHVREDFLIIINANDTKPTRYTEFVNGSFMETFKDHPGGYSHRLLKKLEDALSWNEENLREPQVNCLEAQGMSIEPPDGPNNLRGMRAITTLSLTHSDGYVLYTDGVRDLGPSYPHHHHWWHPFWDANLGQPVGPKAEQYQDVEGLFIREFTSGWAVYNRSGNAQTITLPASAAPVSDRGNNVESQTHRLPDLDGEIYLTTRSFADVNGDGKINILDLVQVANGFGTSAPDPNGDGAVNILDLVFVARQFGE